MSEDPTGSGLGGASSRPATGGVSGRGVAGGVDASAGAARLPNGGASVLGRLYAGTLPLHPHTDDATGGVIDYLRTQWGADHLAAPNPHGQYLTAVPTDYLTQDEGDLRYLPADYVPPASGISQADADLRYLQLTGGTLSGALTITPGELHLADAAGTARVLRYQTGTADRWAVFATNSAETGSNAGSDLYIARYNDAGIALGNAFQLVRATGAATFGAAVTAGGLLTATDYTATAASGNVHLRNSAGQLRLRGVTDIVLEAAAGNVVPSASNAKDFGHAFNQWRVGYFANLQVSGDGSTSSVYATAGAVRLRNGATGNVAWRNAANTANLTLGVDASDQLAFNGTVIPKVTVAASAPSSPATGDLWVW